MITQRKQGAMRHCRATELTTIVSTVLAVALGNTNAATDARATARTILDASNIRGGLVVHLGCGDGAVTAALRANERFIVHGLDTDPANVEKARRTVTAKRLYGPVWISRLTGTRLPYADNMVKLAVVSGGDCRVGREEIERVLAPRGVAVHLDTRHATRDTFRKPVPEDIDEWTHWLHGPDGNAVAADRRVGPPRRMQWIAGPLWSRHHNLMPSVSAMVSANGRIFYIADEAPAAMTGDSPDKWVLIARDAYSGVPLWRIPIADWGWSAWSWRWEGRFNQPNQVAKRLVAVGDKVYVTLGFNAPLTVLDAATGNVLKTYAGTRFTDEILYQDGILILSINHEAQRAAGTHKDPKSGKEVCASLEEDPPIEKSVAAIDAATGKLLWKSGRFVGNSTKTAGMERVTHLLLAARGKRVYLLDRNRVVALDLASGTQLWEAPRPESKRYTSRYFHLMSDMCTLVATDEAVLLCQLEPIQKRIGWRVIKARVRAYAPETGATLWTHPCGNWGHFCVPDTFVTGGLVWVHDSTEMAVLGLDPVTGAEKRRFSSQLAFDNGHHHRCYRNKATERYLVTSYRGYEFLDWEGQAADLNHWVRGACRFGAMPCNGLLYTTPHPCDCYISAKLNGVIALAPEGLKARRARDADDRRVKGPAYGQPPTARPQAAASRHFSFSASRHFSFSASQHFSFSESWPTYRHDPGRSGASPAKVPSELRQRWVTKIPGQLSAPVVDNGRVVVASVDTHGVYALDAATGKTVWQFTAEGRVDTPPTLHKGQALFGCRNGWVYAVRIDDGKLAWRFQAAPEERLVGAFGTLESAWPVHGSVLVQNESVYAVAGRSSYLDGGMVAWRLDPATGKVLERETLANEQSTLVDIGRKREEEYGILADLLIGDGEGVYLRQRRLFDDDSKPAWSNRLGATAGMLDDSWFNRTYWILDGKLHGETLVHDSETVYAVRGYNERGHGGFVQAGQAGHRLVATDRDAAHPAGKKRRKAKSNVWPPPGEAKWSRPVPVRPRAMALAGKTLLCAGTPDLVDPEDAWAAYEGRRGGTLLAVATSDGKTLSEHKLNAGPAKDGLAVAGGCVFVTTVDGSVHCFGKERMRQ